jgi:hypothetical protein
MRTGDAQGLREPAPSFTTSTKASGVASWVFIVLFGGTLVLCVAGLLGLTPLRPPLPLLVGAIVVSAALTAAFVALFVATRGSRLTVDGHGVRAASRAGSIDLPWNEIDSVRVALLVTRQIVPELLVPTALDRHTRARLELRLPRSEALEAEQPLLVRARIRDAQPDGATHQFALPSGRLISTASPQDYSPDLQRLLPTVAGGALLPTEVRSAWSLLH